MKEADFLTMGLLLFYIGPITPTTETTDTENKVLCYGVKNHSYTCETGHCCGESQCCNYYYELWWFWVVWTIIIVLSCCCVCHHRRTKHRLQQQQRQHEINLIAYREAHNYTSLPFYFRFLPNYLLPAYEEVENHPPTPPPPYSALQTSQLGDVGSLDGERQDVPRPPSLANLTPMPPATAPPRSTVEEPAAPAALILTRQRKSSLDLDPDLDLEERGLSETDKLADPCKESPTDRDFPEDKERGSGRHRRFTGDSGIEVCVCGRGAESEDGLLGEEAEHVDFCDACGPGDGDRGLDSVREPPSPRARAGALLHTINEQEGPVHLGSPDSQS